MTVVVAFVGPDGAVMASDSEATESSHSRFDVQKCWCAGGLLMGYTGNTSVKQPLSVAIATNVGQTFGDTVCVDREQARAVLASVTGPVLRDAYQNFVPAQAGQSPAHVLAGALLVAGRDADGFWLLEIDHNNTPTFYTEQGFHTVGSGAPAAHVARALMGGYETPSRSVRHLRLVAYRAVETCIAVIGGPLGVGGHVQLWSAEGDAPFAQADDEECERVAATVEQWRTIERESLDRVVPSAAPQPGASPDVALPPALGADDARDEGAGAAA